MAHLLSSKTFSEEIPSCSGHALMCRTQVLQRMKTKKQPREGGAKCGEETYPEGLFTHPDL